MAKPVKFGPKTPNAPRLDTSFNFGANVTKNKGGGKKKAPAGGGS